MTGVQDSLFCRLVRGVRFRHVVLLVVSLCVLVCRDVFADAPQPMFYYDGVHYGNAVLAGVASGCSTTEYKVSPAEVEAYLLTCLDLGPITGSPYDYKDGHLGGCYVHNGVTQDAGDKFLYDVYYNAANGGGFRATGVCSGSSPGNAAYWQPRISVETRCADGSLPDTQQPLEEQCAAPPSPDCPQPPTDDLTPIPGVSVKTDVLGAEPDTACWGGCTIVKSGGVPTATPYGSWLVPYWYTGDVCNGGPSNNPGGTGDTSGDTSGGEGPGEAPNSGPGNDTSGDSIPDDGNTTNEAATDEGQEVMSGQLKGIHDQLIDIEIDTDAIANNTDGIEGLLEVIAANTSDLGGGGGGDGPDYWESAGGGGDCLSAPVCTGDVIDCAILTQQWQTRCEYTTLNDGVDVSGAGYQPDNGSGPVDIAALVAGVTNQSGFLPRSCPGDAGLSLSFGSYSISYSPLCTLAESMAPLVLILSGLIAARNIGAAVLLA